MSTLEPTKWNVVVVASWNRAILTPSGIATRLFNLPDGAAVEVYIPVERLEPAKVVYDGMGITVASSRLDINVENPSFQGMDRAKAIAAKALTCLPETPASAAGYNFRFQVPVEGLDILAAFGEPNRRLADKGFPPLSYGLSHQVQFQSGVINSKLEIREGLLSVELNLHTDSREHEQLKNWLEVPMPDVKAAILRYTEALGLPKWEEKHD
jgi:hypothetical protein